MRLIDADALSDLLDVEYRRKMELVKKGETHLNTLAEGIFSVSVVIGTMPTVDAVEVVRCKDCGYCMKDDPADDFGYCINPDGIDNYAKPDDFCSYGERRKDDT